ncbi:AraC-like DNA-binding protein [Pedobacter cryoconitis]|uniref:AraC-like DNA-binding protein n=1 Tax=Pedobacter cryoconitis TaxID=188932 RepID=A0A7W8ZIJ9_9SPHI|nr:AraC family transcriptional regulator [Pedobacter cryoconitis]MBB5634438.1 AraC-like DNA-binding protein [Pedobacter cryoconitis]
MEITNLDSRADFFFSCIEKKYYSKKMMINCHVLIKIVSGGTRIVHSDKAHVFGAGDTMLISRNQLAKVTKYPVDGEPYRAISVFFRPGFLQKYYVSHQLNYSKEEIPKIKIFDQHPLLDSLFNSLLPYFTLKGELPAEIADGKVYEAISILRTLDRGVDHILGHFEEPGKIDLADFMSKNYMFNMPLEKFGYLTGRSLTTFKKDFKKAFNTTPQKWLTKKRLELAHYQIFEEKKKPSDVYFEAGFENLSHFSFAFKKQFGYNPTASS